MSRRRDGRRCWPTSAAYGAIAAGWGAGPARVTAATTASWFSLGAGVAAVFQ